ncbi:hypothetical protein ACNTMW_27960 [Planosporangium sp. 12N6]|uniref:hypothetical protein n=1 Tax=Planosporangium spinosum TaxID=3402278 RepID=UPI003CEA8E38
MNLEDCDHVYGFLLGSLLPFVVAPPGSVPRLRGVVRVDAERARVALSDDASMASGVSAEFALPELFRDGSLRDVDLAIAYVFSEIAQSLRQISQNPLLRKDSHANVVCAVSASELIGASAEVPPNQDLFRLLAQLYGGPALPQFREVYKFSGFMLRGPNRCRIYVQASSARTSYGLDIPLTRSSGESIFGVAAGFVQELASKLHTDGQLFDPIINQPDDYCNRVYDLTSWINPPRMGFPLPPTM